MRVHMCVCVCEREIERSKHLRGLWVEKFEIVKGVRGVFVLTCVLTNRPPIRSQLYIYIQSLFRSNPCSGSRGILLTDRVDVNNSASQGYEK